MDLYQRDELEHHNTQGEKLVINKKKTDGSVQVLCSDNTEWKSENEEEESGEEEKEEEEEEEEDERHNQRESDKISLVVPDGGWGWLVALGGFIITMFLSSLSPCFGILFSRYLLELGASSTMTAWIFNTQLFIWHIVGLLVRPLSAEFGWRPVGFVGVLLCSASIVISAFSPSAGFLFFSFSLLSGVGGGLVVSMCYIIIPQYFDHRRGLANAIMMMGLCMGQILGAPFVRYLQDHHGFLGSTLIFGAIMLHGCVGAAFFHPVEWHLKKVKEEEEQAPSDGLSPLILQKRNKLENGSQVDRPRSGEVHTDEYYKESVVVDSDATYAETNEISGSRRANKRSYESLGSDDVILQVKHSLPISITNKRTNESQMKKKTQGPMKLVRITVRVARSTISDLQILRSRRALVIAFGNMLCMNAYFNFVMMVPFAMQAANLTLQDSAWCITLMGICNLLSRIVISIMSDWPGFSMRLCCMTGYFVLATVMFVFPLLREVKWLLVAMSVFGCGLAATISLLHLVMIEYMGMENLAAVFGSTCLLIGFGFPTFGPLIGFIRDLSGSYTVSMWILSAMSSTAFILWLFMPAAVSYDKKKMKNKKTEQSKLTAPVP